MWRRAALAAVLAGLWLVTTGPAAGAHAMLRGSDPAAGASLDRAPGRVTLTFTEAPDPALSVVHVLDTSGREVSAGPAAPVAGSQLQLRAGLRALGAGTYTVTWRAVSRVDGHVSQGAFAFGVGLPAMATPSPNAGASVDVLQGPGPLAVAARWAFYWGFALLLGAAATGLLVFERRLPARAGLLLGAAARAGEPRRRQGAPTRAGGEPHRGQGAPTRAGGEPGACDRLACRPGGGGVRRVAGARARRARGGAGTALAGQPVVAMGSPAGRRRLDRRAGVAAGGHRWQASRGAARSGRALLAPGHLEPGGGGAQQARARQPGAGRLGSSPVDLLRPYARREAGAVRPAGGAGGGQPLPGRAGAGSGQRPAGVAAPHRQGRAGGGRRDPARGRSPDPVAPWRRCERRAAGDAALAGRRTGQRRRLHHLRSRHPPGEPRLRWAQPFRRHAGRLRHRQTAGRRPRPAERLAAGAARRCRRTARSDPRRRWQLAGAGLGPHHRRDLGDHHAGRAAGRRGHGPDRAARPRRATELRRPSRRVKAGRSATGAANASVTGAFTIPRIFRIHFLRTNARLSPYEMAVS